MSDPVLVREGEKKTGYRILMLKARTEPHKANLIDDYQRIQQAAEAKKKEEKVDEWIKRKRPNFFIKIDSQYSDCDFQTNWNQP